jgi:hypothetical protein
VRGSAQGSSGNAASSWPDRCRRRPSPPAGGSPAGTCRGRACAYGVLNAWTAEPASSSSPRRCPPTAQLCPGTDHEHLSVRDRIRPAPPLPGKVLSKTRPSVAPLGIDVFDPPLHSLVLAEAEFTTDEIAQSFLPPRAATARSPTTPSSPEAVLSRLASMTCSLGSPSTASSSRRPSDLNPATGTGNYSPGNCR